MCTTDQLQMYGQTTLVPPSED